MNLEQLRAKLVELRDLPTETEWAEFKHNNSDPQMIGEYLSAISNAAALENQAFGYIVWGIEDGTHNVVGTAFKPRQQKGHGNEDLEPWLNKLLAPRINFRIFEFETESGLPMVIFEVQAANTAPIAFSGRRYVRVGSHKKPLAEHPEKERKLWEIVSGPAVDWSAGICEAATLDHLDPKAIHRARSEYAERFEGDPKKAHLAKEVWQWDDVTSLLAQAMVNLNMIDTIGSGIKRTFHIQRDRNFPMPTYGLSEPERVKVRLIGQILDPNYTRMLMSQTDLDLFDVMALDKVQKGCPIHDEEIKSLRAKKLIEGRKPNLHVSADVAAATDTMVDYLKKRGIDRDYCRKMVMDLLERQGKTKRGQIDSLLREKLSDALNEQQKQDFTTNLLQKLRRDGEIVVHGKGQAAFWELSKVE